MKPSKFLPLFVAFITGLAVFNIVSSIHEHRDIGFVSVFFAGLGLLYFVDIIINRFK